MERGVLVLDSAMIVSELIRLTNLLKFTVACANVGIVVQTFVNTMVLAISMTLVLLLP